MTLNSRRPKTLAIAASLSTLLLVGCVNDTASYPVDRESEQTIMLSRNQDLFWQDTVKLTIVADQVKRCQEGIDLHNVPRRAEIHLYQPPPGTYAEAIHILAIEDRHYAVATQPCGIDAFPGPAPALGTLVGTFEERDGVFQFTPAEH